MANEKPKLQYKIVSGYNPKTKKKNDILRAILVNREVFGTDRIVEYALNAGYVRGQSEDMKGALNGFVQAFQQLALQGKVVVLSNWLKIHAELTGSVGETLLLSDANELHVVITALKDLKTPLAGFSVENVEGTTAWPKIDTILSPGGKPWEVVKTRGILLTGRNLYFDEQKGDTATISWGEGESRQTISITPTESDYSHMLFAWPTALADIEAGTKLTFSFRTCAGIEGGAVYPMTKEAKLVAV